jgi:transposase
MPHLSVDEQAPSIFGGVDTHRDVHVAAALNSFGVLIGTASFGSDAAGHQRLLAWLGSFGSTAVVGVEGTGSYGAGLARHLRAAGVGVAEVDRPDRRARRRRGKADAFDAEAAARAAMAGVATAIPKDRTGPVEAIRVLRAERRSAIKARTAAVNQIHAQVITASPALRAPFEQLSELRLAQRAAALRPGPDISDPLTATKQALRRLGRRVLQLTEEINQIDAELAPLVDLVAPRALARFGAGVHTVAQLLITIGDNPQRMRSEAAFAHLCGASPIPASSGRTDRHRLNRGGDRQANAALHTIALTRLAHDPQTRDYAARRRGEGLATRDILRCLKRLIARELYTALRADLAEWTHPGAPAATAGHNSRHAA